MAIGTEANTDTMPQAIPVWKTHAEPDQPIPPSSKGYDAIVFVGFGGPEGPDDVIPFLENVLRGKPVPRERLLEVAEHYNHFGGKSPINDQTIELIEALRPELDRSGIRLPIYWGNRNWHPMLPDTVQKMADDGVTKALAVVTSAYSCYSGCRQYRENIEAAIEQVGQGAPTIDKMRVYYNHPDFIVANADRVRDGLGRIAIELRDQVHIAYTAHSIPQPMSDNSNYVTQLTEACKLVSENVGIPESQWQLVYQSRSGRPSDPWLEPDILDLLKDLKSRGVRAVIVHPIGFLSDHMEVMFDLDEEAKQTADEQGMTLARSATVGTHPAYVGMLRELIDERINGGQRRAIGTYRASHDVCPPGCCMSGRRGEAPGKPAPMVLANS